MNLIAACFHEPYFGLGVQIRGDTTIALSAYSSYTICQVCLECFPNLFRKKHSRSIFCATTTRQTYSAPAPPLQFLESAENSPLFFKRHMEYSLNILSDYDRLDVLSIRGVYLKARSCYLAIGKARLKQNLAILEILLSCFIKQDLALEILLQS